MSQQAMNFIQIIFLVLFTIFGISLPASAQSVQPVFQIQYPNPTADKPQSKLWYSHGRWWALLPHEYGQTLWERSEAGWKEHPEVVSELKGVRGQADVWPETDKVTAVSTDRQKIYVFRLTYGGEGWQGKPLATLSLPEGKEDMVTMTATIALDGGGHWWIAADVGGSICVWNSKDALTWSQPTILGDEVKAKEDLCLVTALPGGIGVIWTDQVKDRVVIREHVDGAPVDEWKPETIIEEGNGTADNHLKAALASDGTLWVATKNSVDKIGQSQLVLRVRSPQGEWSNYHYAPREEGLEPSRPAVYATSDPKAVLLGHNVYNRTDSEQGSIEFGRVDLTAPEILTENCAVILPEKEMKSEKIRDITGPKFPFPADAPWIILAADSGGQIYEADLKTLLEKP